ncbi:hypothetical protein JKP88DRAFT_281520 [Tribonema minus]|uniref:Uncharacterized protein n=1 Tax=Tribonema minus TaxID=303371 RepID=A0A835YMP9_9STRA|nr:hypothetical protein JKP88DRAFT_281520 [Tribonema minus]
MGPSDPPLVPSPQWQKLNGVLFLLRIAGGAYGVLEDVDKAISAQQYAERMSDVTPGLPRLQAACTDGAAAAAAAALLTVQAQAGVPAAATAAAAAAAEAPSVASMAALPAVPQC